MLWQGNEADSCNEYISLKSIKYLPDTKGIYESCDGGKLPIGEVYYLEYLFYSDSEREEFVNPTELDLIIARKHGYIPMNN